jgi:hypothetical protein
MGSGWVALVLGAVVLAAGGVIFYYARAPRLAQRAEGMSPPPAPTPADPRPTAQPAVDKATLAPRLVRPDTVAVVYPAPSKPLALSKEERDSPAPVVPKVVSRLGTTVTRLPSYFEAYADARAEMDEGLDYVGFRRVFAPSRFSSPESLRTARRTVAAAVNILRVYRVREVMLEQTYRAGEPDDRGSLREAFEVAEASRGLLADLDSLFAILVAQEGAVRYRDDALFFQNPGAARAYADIRRRVIETLADPRDSVEAANRVTMPRLIRAFGPDRPPPAR